MADAAVLAVAACQLAVTVIPQAVDAWPIVWEKIVKTFKRLPRTHNNQDINTNLAIIHTILDTLEHIPDLPWTCHVQAILSRMKLQAESVEKKLVNDSAMKRYFRKAKIAARIQFIASTMLVFEMNVRMHDRQATTSENQNADSTGIGLVQFYKKSQANLHNDILTQLRDDNLEPVLIMTYEQYEQSTRRSGTYNAISYNFNFQPASGFPRTLTVSRGVRECIEVLLRWLRDLKLNRDTSNNVEFARMIGVAFIDVFTEKLPEALLQHLCESRSKLEPRAARQFDENLEFFRSFSRSATFEAIQGKDGLKLEDYEKVSLDLLDSGWTAWNHLHQVSAELRDQGPANNHRASSSRGATHTTSENVNPWNCVICGICIRGHLPKIELTQKQHFDICFQKALRWNAGSARGAHCPICKSGLDHLPNDQRQSHANACLDRLQS